MTKKLKTFLKIALPLLFGVLILWLLYRNMDFQALKQTLQGDADFFVIVIASAMGTVGNSFRGLRWHLLNKTLGMGQARLRNSFLTTHGTYAVNMALPRVGEVWRCASMSQYTSGLRFTQFFGTLLVDRAFDVVVILLLILLAGLSNWTFFSDFFSQNPDFLHTLQALLHSPWFYIGVAFLVVLIGLGVLYLKRSGGGGRIRESLSKIVEGLRTVSKMERKWLFYLYTVLIWGSYFLQFYITFGAFSFTEQLPMSVALLAFTMGGIAVAAPVQAGMGAWHFMIIYTLVAFGVGQVDASSFALIVHTFQTLWTTLFGLLAVLLLPFVNAHTAKEQR